LVLITHDLGVVAGVADRVVVMYAGKVVEQAGTEELFAHPAHPYTQGLLASVPRVDEGSGRSELRSIEGSPPDLVSPPSGCRFLPRCLYGRGVCHQEPPLEGRGRRGHQVACWVDVTSAEEQAYGEWRAVALNAAKERSLSGSAQEEKL
jgi:oligopeptide/dipeptide ABC transporter ATP-binding protein